MTEDEAVTVLSEFAQYLDEYVVRPAVEEIKAAAEQSPWHLFGEYLRDAAVLIIVFVPLDYFVTSAVEQKAPIPARFWAAVAGFSFALLLLGIWCSTRGRK
jgi:hypothetical protein